MLTTFSPQAITKQFAEILHFTLSFDDLKVYTALYTILYSVCILHVCSVCKYYGTLYV